jgi:hypothetical protein
LLLALIYLYQKVTFIIRACATQLFYNQKRI